MFAHFWLRQCRIVLRPHLYYLPSRFTIVKSLYWVFGLYGVSPVFAVAFALLARAIPAPVLVLALRSAADVVVFFPNSAVFRASCGDFCSCFGILALPLLFLGYAYGVALFALSAYSSLISILRWLT